MRKRGVLAEAAKDPALHTQIAQRRGAVVGKLFLRHAVAHGSPGRAIRDQEELIGFSKQSNLGRRFEHAATRSDRCGADKLELGSFLTNAVEKKEAHPLFHADAARVKAAVANDLRSAPVRTFV